ncbi:hypothetical protein MUN81_15495 [Hymenobacter sp. 5317J-9]|uniref:hypothetical protein n=1 Tax=Hymenobacter sp. 5317J-9 TaxID=2932250 RepID=UPI001FD6E961|nr:hypothetical protein [Hymenobacter sp. 5317J-9]UOQ96640.1 hypothetical protein MUN81_15495 [Hymenobacter sp. 5317J-9]
MAEPVRKMPRTLGLLLLLVLGLACLKEAGVAPVAHWSWWAVTAPVWAPWAALLTGALLLMGFKAGRGQ